MNSNVSIPTMKADVLTLVRIVMGPALVLLLSACTFPNYDFVSDGGTQSEDCNNGTDDDGDGLVDCEDADCKTAGYQCVTVIPKDWNGPVAFWSGKASELAPTCASSEGYDTVLRDKLYSGLSLEPASCPTCDCAGTPTGEKRTVTVRWVFSPGACAFSAGDLCPRALSPGCQSVPLTRAGLTDAVKNANPGEDSSYSLYVDILTSDITGGNCEPVTSGDPIKKDPYSGIGRLCGSVPPGTCKGNGQVCVKKPSAAFDSAICIYRAGKDQQCPTGWSVPKPSQYVSFDDQRTCSACECPADWGASPTSKGSIYDYGSERTCSGSWVTNATNNGETGSVPYLTSATETRYYDVKVEAVNTPSCAIVDATPVGEVTGESITVCCSGE